MSTSLLTIDYSDRSDHAWPRILQFIAIITIIYAAVRIGLKICEAWFTWDFLIRSGRASLISQLTWALLSLIEIVIGLVLIVGAVTLLRSGSQRWILVGQWGMVISWFAVLIAGYIMQPAHLTLSFVFNTFSQAIYQNILPIMIVVILRANRQPFSGWQMERKPVIQADSAQPFVGLWPRLLNIICIMMLLFSLMQLVAVIIYVNPMLHLPAPLTAIRDSGEAFTFSTVLLIGLADILMASGVVRLYTRRAAGLLIVGLWLWLLVWAAGVVRNFFENGPLFNVLATENLFQEFAFATFPALVLLILRQYTGYPLLPRNPLLLFRQWLVE